MKCDLILENETDQGEGRFPFLMKMYEDEIPPEDGRKESGRSKNVTNGITMILARWPRYVTVMFICMGATFLFAIIILLLLPVISHFMGITLDESARLTQQEFLNLDAHCKYRHEEDRMQSRHRRGPNNIFDSVRFQQPSFEKPRKHIGVGDLSIPAERKVFFVSGDDTISSRKLCAIESAAKHMKNHNFYFIILSINNTADSTVSDKRLDNLLRFHQNIKIFRLNGDKYFHESPLRGLLHKSDLTSSLIEFAARVLTLWRYGGITYDLELVTLDNTGTRSYPFPDDASVMISEDGDVMSTSLQCHTFLYTVMISLTSRYIKRDVYQEFCSNQLLEHAMEKFCANADEYEERTAADGKSFDVCRGVTTMGTCMICKNGEESDTDCIWLLSSTTDLLTRKNMCPISYRKNKTRPLSDTNTIKFYEMRYMNLP
jgi:hypothetical protein